MSDRSARTTRRMAVGVAIVVAVVAIGVGVARLSPYTIHEGPGGAVAPRCYPFDGIPGSVQPDNDCNRTNLGHLDEGVALEVVGVALVIGVLDGVVVSIWRSVVATTGTCGAPPSGPSSNNAQSATPASSVDFPFALGSDIAAARTPGASTSSSHARWNGASLSVDPARCPFAGRQYASTNRIQRAARSFVRHERHGAGADVTTRFAAFP